MHSALAKYSFSPSAPHTIEGTLLNGDILDTTFDNSFGGSIELNVGPVPAPKPSAWAAFAVGLVGLGALTLRVRRRTV